MKVLIVRLSSIGDVVQGIPCLVALKESFPTWEISWLVEETSAPVLENHPCLHRLFVVGRQWREGGGAKSPAKLAMGLREMAALSRLLRDERFDIAIDLQGLFKSGLWAWLSGAKRRVGHNRTREFSHLFLNEWVSARPTFDPSFPLIQRYLEPARYLGADITKGRYALPPSSQEAMAGVDRLLGPTAAESPTLALFPWSLWPSKNWPLARWRELASALAQDFRVLVLGASSHHDEAARFVSEIPKLINLVGQTPLSLLPEIFRRCAVVVGPDTGPLHLANAVGKPRVLMIFGSTSWRRSGPFGKGHAHVSTELSCQPCFKRACPLGHLNCLQSIDAKRVLDLCHALATRPSSSAQGCE